MDRYQKVEKQRVETPIDEMRSYITYAMTLLQEKESEEIVFKRRIVDSTRTGAQCPHSRGPVTNSIIISLSGSLLAMIEQQLNIVQDTTKAASQCDANILISQSKLINKKN
ncbi:hypothetical protein RND71_023608 [Anisodus tanguticus]|uniref:Uncharacterized protein n=1 Tax=Anisodus tanguticus TaxID=243964 RepID=A0AAE1V678_9SOLA|nr:hypothetical protein RND71_023608 [Anisodus tanguticus]